MQLFFFVNIHFSQCVGEYIVGLMRFLTMYAGGDPMSDLILICTVLHRNVTFCVHRK